MSKKIYFISSLLIFFGAFFYVHQKNQIYIEGYRLTKNYHLLNEYIDKRDALIYNFTQKVSIPKINGWLETSQFSFIDKNKLVALRPKEHFDTNKKVASRKGNIKIIFTTSNAFAKEQQ